ncbi:MAG: DMT family transporter [Chloroflexi bacterium]|nr:DMT family transporter [Chloroflexota bacterium]
MVAIAGGLGAAMCWAIATLSSSRSSRMIGAVSVLAWVMIVGLAVTVVPALLVTPVNLGTTELVELVLTGLSYTAGLLLAYRALTIGRVSIVAPITATEGAVAALISVGLGEPLAGTTALLLGVITIGVVLAAIERAVDEERGPRTIDPATQRRAALLAVSAAAAFSVGLVTAGRLGEAGIPAPWVIMAGRIVGTALIALPLIAAKRLRLSRRAAPLVIVSGILEALGNGLYVVAAHDGVAAAAILASQFAAFAAIGAFILFGERLQRVQVLGVVMIAVGVTVLAMTQA